MEEPRGVVINMCDSVQFASKAVIKKKKALLVSLGFLDDFALTLRGPGTHRATAICVFVYCCM